MDRALTELCAQLSGMTSEGIFQDLANSSTLKLDGENLFEN